jgi:hypothetical protein
MNKDIDLGRIVQLLDQVDLDRLGKLLGMLGSHRDGEIVNAARAADKLIRTAGMVWADFTEAAGIASSAFAAAEALLAENDMLRAQLAEAEAGRGAIASWQDINAPIGNHRGAAKWALTLHAQGAVWLSGFELSFLARCTTWDGRLTLRMQPVFDKILTRVIERTGLRPPPDGRGDLHIARQKAGRRQCW